MAHDLSGYEEVPDRIRRFFEKHPEGSLQAKKVEYREMPAYHLNGEMSLHIIYHAAAYRTPDDPRPGHGMASEPLPGLTPYTRGSELMNAETSAWGRALVALGFVAKKVASQQEVDSRKGAPEGPQTGSYGQRPKEYNAAGDNGKEATPRQKGKVRGEATKAGVNNVNDWADFTKRMLGKSVTINDLTFDQASFLIDRLQQGAIPTGKSDLPEDAPEHEKPPQDETLPFDESKTS
jgi:hypothetical protein